MPRKIPPPVRAVQRKGACTYYGIRTLGPIDKVPENKTVRSGPAVMIAFAIQSEQRLAIAMATIRRQSRCSRLANTRAVSLLAVAPASR